MTTIDDILALAAHATPTEQAAADLILFAGAVTRGMNSDVVRALRALRPGSLPDSPAWRAWLSATAAASSAAASSAAGRTVRFAVCAAAAALSEDAFTAPADSASASAAPAASDSASAAAGAPAAAASDTFAAVSAGTAAAALVESGLPDAEGWSVPAVAAVIGAGLAAGIMLRLPEAGLRHALGICATQAAGLRAAAGTAAGPLQAGKAAFNAVEAAHLARLGFTSSRDPLDGRRGLFALFNR